MTLPGPRQDTSVIRVDPCSRRPTPSQEHKMTVNYAQAEQARNAVLKAYGIYLREGLVAKVSAANIRDIVQILPQAQYQIHFSDVFCKFFASTNVVAFGQPVPDPHA